MSRRPLRFFESWWTSLDPRERAWVLAAAAVALVALASRLHNAFAYPPLHDFDGPGHGLNVLAFYQGRLPDLRSWVGFHPPLYHAAGALLWKLLPEAVPVHTGLRCLSAAAGVAAVALTWRILARRGSAADAAVVATLVLCTPMVAIATSMLGNETTCALFSTWVLARLTSLPRDPKRAVRHALLTGVAGGLAMLSKSTGLVVVGVAVLAYATRYRGGLRTALLSAAATGGVALVIAAPHFARLLGESGGSPLAIVSGAALSPDLEAEMRSHPPGERRLSDYFSLPAATFLAPVYYAPGLERSVPGLLYASLWADGHAQFLPANVPPVLTVAACFAVLGLLPVGLALRGLAAILVDAEKRVELLFPLLFSALLVLSLLQYAWVFPTYAAVKASYLLPLLLPASLALAEGLGGCRGWLREALRASLLGISAAAIWFTWWGWWE